MEFTEYQEEAVKTAIYPHHGEGNWMYPALGLASEVGELMGKLKKSMRDDGGQMTLERLDAINGELGDLLWYVAVLMEELGLDFDIVASNNLEKLKDRQERGVLGGDGDKR